MTPIAVAQRLQHGERAQQRRAIRRYTDRTAHDAANLACAQIIVGNPGRYPGVMQTWARMVLARLSWEIPKMEAA